MNKENSKRFIQPFGFSEMYEWAKIPEQKLGLFVQFNKRYPNMVEPYHSKDGVLVGISTICSLIESDDPSEWHGAYLYNDVGDAFIQKQKLAVGVKQYDQNIELSYITTRPYEHYIKVENEKYDKRQKYIKRSGRAEWVRVNMLGKAIVIDNGTCTPGNYCMPYAGDDASLFGTAVPYSDGSIGLYVLERVSKTSILVLNNSICNL